jgi:hypothetical protein
VTGRAATSAALYAGFLAAWAFGDAVRRRAPSRYLLLGGALLELALLVGAALGASRLGGAGGGGAVHAGYLAASVALLPVGLLMARDPDDDGRLAAAPLAIALVALAVVILRVDATA